MKRPISFVNSCLISSIIVTFGLALSADATSRDRAIILAQGAPPEICTEVYLPVCGTDPSGKGSPIRTPALPAPRGPPM